MASPFDTGASKTPDPFEFLKALWSPMGMPMPGLVTPTLDPNEIDKRISDLKSVENWLNLNLNVLRMTIQGLEMQRATLSAMQGMQGGMAAAARAMQGQDAEAAAPSSGNAAADAWWSVLQQAQKATEQVVTQVATQAANMAGSVPGSGESGKK